MATKEKPLGSCSTALSGSAVVEFQSIRYKVFVQKFPSLVEALSPVVVKFAVNARSKSLISNYSKTQAENPFVHEYDRASILMSQILSKIKDSDAHFDDFITILQDMNLTKLAYELKSAVDPTLTSGDSDSCATRMQACGFRCPCGQCTFESYFKDRSKCQKKDSFPFLNKSHLNKIEEDVLTRQLIHDANIMSDDFQDFSGKVFKTLEKNATPVDKIINTIFCSSQRLPRPIEDRHGDQLDTITTIPGIQKFLVRHKYISFINYRFLEKIIDEHCQECQADLDYYLEKLQTFCKRSIFEVPTYAIMSPATSSDNLLVVKVIDELWFGSTQRGKLGCLFTLRDIDAIKNKVSKVVELRHGYIGLVDVGAGCIQLAFSILSYQEDPIFPLTTSQLSELIRHGIIVLYQPKPQLPTNGQVMGGQFHKETSSKDSATPPILLTIDIARNTVPAEERPPPEKRPRPMLDVFENEEVRKNYMASGKDTISILFTGKMGTGKSSMVNGIMGRKVAKENAKSVTSEITAYTESFVVQEIGKEVTIKLWDTPGLSDPDLEEEEEAAIICQLEGLKEDVDHVFYCLDMRRRLETNDVDGMKKFSEKVGPDIWNYTTFALTFANTVVPSDDDEDKVEHFQTVITSWIESLRNKMIKKLKLSEEIVNKIPIVPVGYKDKSPPDREEWFSPLWVTAFQRMKPEAQPSMYAVSAQRIKPKKIDQISQQPKQPENKNIYLNAQYPEYTMGSSTFSDKVVNMFTAVGAVGGRLVGAAVGAAVGAVVGTVGGYALVSVGSIVKSIVNKIREAVS